MYISVFLYRKTYFKITLNVYHIYFPINSNGIQNIAKVLSKFPPNSMGIQREEREQSMQTRAGLL